MGLGKILFTCTSTTIGAAALAMSRKMGVVEICACAFLIIPNSLLTSQTIPPIVVRFWGLGASSFAQAPLSARYTVMR